MWSAKTLLATLLAGLAPAFTEPPADPVPPKRRPDSTASANDDDGLDAAEREALHESIREGLADMKAGRTFDVAEVIAEIRSEA